MREREKGSEILYMTVYRADMYMYMHVHCTIIN